MVSVWRPGATGCANVKVAVSCFSSRAILALAPVSNVADCRLSPAWFRVMDAVGWRTSTSIASRPLRVSFVRSGAMSMR